ncbi:MAG: DUF2062 domain-containing protein [Fibrobacter sp.]|nr:DUF2062 domain-containing protein [Fibrobacter sp.]
MISIAIIIPVCNNAETISDVISSVKRYKEPIIVIDDGSTDGTGDILCNTDGIQLIQFDRNRGKGAALKAGFHLATKSGFTHAITVDADGQHLPEDIGLLIKCINEDPEALWTGERSGDGHYPLSYSFGNWICRFWCYLSTGLTLKDPLCGFRAYPLEYVNNLQYRTGDRFEFELEVLLIAAWNHLSVKTVPVHIFNSTEKKIISHFRPFYDFARIVRSMGTLFFPREDGAKRFSWNRLAKNVKNLVRRELRANATPFKASVSLAAGVFLAITPFHGFQVLMLLIATFLFKLNRPLALLGVSISSAPLLPFWFAAGAATGKAMVPESIVSMIVGCCRIFPSSFSGGELMHTAVYYFLGSILLAVICGILTFGVSYLLFRWRSGESFTRR